MDPETEIRRINRLGLNLEKLAKEIEENAADCFELDAILKKIVKIKQQLEQANEYFIRIKDTDELLLQMEEVTDKYCKLEVKILRFTQHFHNNANLPLSNNAVNNNYANLPKLELPFFDGKLENWISFSNVFKTTIIDNSQLTNIVKLQYLKTCLKGKALVLVNHIPITENNLYDNKRDLIFNLIQRIIDLPKITIESSTQLLFLVDNSYEIIRSLETLGYKLDELSDIIIGKILTQLEHDCDNNHIPSCSELLKFIETNAKALNTSKTERGLPLIKRSMKLQVHNLTKANCFLCQQEHGIYLCPTFLDMEPIERRKKVKQLKLCFNCLRNNHSVNQCRSEFKCRKCQGKHNTLIHIDGDSPPGGQTASSTCVRSRIKKPEFLVEKYEEFKKLSYNYKMYPPCHLTLTQKYSAAYLIRVIAILLIIGGVELNPGPPTKKQTTLSTVRTPETKEVMEDDLKSIVIQIHTELRTLGARLESRLHNIEQKFDEWDQRLTVIETSQKTCLELATKNDLRIKTLEDHGDMLDRKTRENNLIFYGIKGPEAENSDETLCKLVTAINEKMQIQIESEIMRCHRLSKKANAPILVEIPKQTTRIALLRNSYKLRGDKIFVNKDYTLKTREQRRLLITKKKELSEKGIHSKLRDNKLFANGQKYEVVDGRVVGEKGSTS
ncbi:hypothetical protein LAZ67_3002560 [Cordylochernes scorpioides]|uniref:Uncharacterized protein n=1 Tax=Cordylochernes scorpioides TaxID=51811 RepID=A0ABY6K7W7_9ARAC|nr:hypothetical protein LAZ67_3002560 [Cordylochernes scorpioides]